MKQLYNQSRCEPKNFQSIDYLQVSINALSYIDIEHDGYCHTILQL